LIHNLYDRIEDSVNMIGEYCDASLSVVIG